MEINAPAAPGKAAPDAAAAPPDLAALIGARICHDLNNPLGAIGNGLELMQLAGRGDGPELALIAQSVAAARARLRFLRLALGTAAAGQRIGGAELAGVVAAQFAGGRLAVDWPVPAELGRDEARLGLLVLMCLEAALPFGGRVAARHGTGGWRFEAEAARLRDLGALWEVACGARPAAGIAAAMVQFALVPAAAGQLGRRVALACAPGRIAVAA